MDFARSLPAEVGRAILSNSGDGAREEEERRFGFSEVFDPICCSHEQGVNTPDPRALERLDARPCDVIFIGDHEGNVSAAEALGLTAHHHTDSPTTIAAVRAFLS